MYLKEFEACFSVPLGWNEFVLPNAAEVCKPFFLGENGSYELRIGSWQKEVSRDVKRKELGDGRDETGGI